MRSAITPLQILRPKTLDEALGMLREDANSQIRKFANSQTRQPSNSPARLLPIAGCTDVYVQLEFGQTPAQRYLDLWQLEELRGIEVRDSALRIGALTTYTDIMRSIAARAWIPMLVEASRLVGGVQIQNRGTIGGNIGNGSPAGDSLPVLAAAEAIVELRSADGIRRVPFTQFYTGYRQAVMQPDELIVAVEIPRIEGRQWFRKVGTRAAQAISKVVIAAVRSDAPRVSIGSVAATVVRLPRTEAALATGTIEAAQQILLEEITPIDDLRSTAEYRKRVAANLLARFWHDTSQ